MWWFKLGIKLMKKQTNKQTIKQKNNNTKKQRRTKERKNTNKATHKKQNKTKQKTCFMGGRTFEVGSVSQDIFIFWWQKMTPLRNTNISQKFDSFWRRILEKSSGLFSKIFCQIFYDFGPKQLILHDFSTLKKKKKYSQNGKSVDTKKKKSPKMENLGWSGP